MKDTNENRVAHLQIVQAVIDRMTRNSFLLKGWAVTLVAALFALAAVDTREQFLFIALLPALVFWALDAYYLRQERLFRCLYDNVRTTPERSLGDVVFSMDTSPYSTSVHPWFATLSAPTIAGFHGAILLAVVVGIIVLAVIGGEESCPRASAGYL